MKIAIFTDTFLPKIDGIAISTKSFCERLTAKGHEFVIICPRYGPDDAELLDGHTPIIRLKNFPLPSYPDVKVVYPQKKKIRKALADFQPDLVHIQTPGLTGRYGIRAARKQGVPIVGTYHTLMTEMAEYATLYRLLRIDKIKKLLFAGADSRKIIKKMNSAKKIKKKKFTKKIIKQLTNQIYSKCETIITPTKIIGEDLKQQGIKKPIKVISNGINPDYFAEQGKTLYNPPYRILHSGRLSFEKNVHVVLKAYYKLLEKNPDITLDLIGDGPALTPIQKEIQFLRLEKQIRTHGFIPHEELIASYDQYDLFITASTMETQGLVALEAMARGLPVVGVNAYALPELIHHGQNGYLAEPHDHEAMSHYISLILSNPQLYASFSQKALATARQHDVNRSVDQLEKLYQQTISKRVQKN